MNTKLTLTIDDSIIDRAKAYAKDKGRSLSDLIENYLKAITREQHKSDIEITPIVKSLQVLLRPRMGLIIRRNWPGDYLKSI